jgi:hypothetical protein
LQRNLFAVDREHTQSRHTRESSASARADMHCHSTASQVSKLGVQRAAGLPECATPPQEVYELAKRRGMADGYRRVLADRSREVTRAA